MLEIQSSIELLQWSDLLYGIFHIDLSNCIAALIRVVLPSMLTYWNRLVLLYPCIINNIIIVGTLTH